MHSYLLQRSKECCPPPYPLQTTSISIRVYLLIRGVSALPEIVCNTEHKTKNAAIAAIVNRPNCVLTFYMCDKILSSCSDLSHEYCKLTVHYVNWREAIYSAFFQWNIIVVRHGSNNKTSRKSSSAIVSINDLQ